MSVVFKIGRVSKLSFGMQAGCTVCGGSSVEDCTPISEEFASFCGIGIPSFYCTLKNVYSLYIISYCSPMKLMRWSLASMSPLGGRQRSSLKPLQPGVHARGVGLRLC